MIRKMKQEDYEKAMKLAEQLDELDWGENYIVDIALILAFIGVPVFFAAWDEFNWGHKIYLHAKKLLNKDESR